MRDEKRKLDCKTFNANPCSISPHVQTRKPGIEETLLLLVGLQRYWTPSDQFSMRSCLNDSIFWKKHLGFLSIPW